MSMAGIERLVPPREPRGVITYSCKSCGAPVHDHESACTYCATANPHAEWIEVTTLADKAPRYVVRLKA